MIENPYAAPQNETERGLRLRWPGVSIAAALGIIGICMLVFAAIGGGIGWMIGTFVLNYYRSLLRHGNEDWFDPVSFGLGQGMTQGIAGGVVVGLILIALFIWRETRQSSREFVE